MAGSRGKDAYRCNGTACRWNPARWSHQPPPGVAGTVRFVCYGGDGEVADLFAGPGAKLYRHARRARDCARRPKVRLQVLISRAGYYQEPIISNAGHEDGAAKSRGVALGGT